MVSHETRAESPPSAASVDTLWYTRCPVPTASSIAIDLGFLDAEFARDGIAVNSLRVTQDRAVRESHFDHAQDDSFREGGNIPPMWARSVGADTRLIATGWVDEYQAIIARPDSGIGTVKDLGGRRLGLPRRMNDRVDYWRAMCLRGFLSALSTEGMSGADVAFVELPVAERYIGDEAGGRTQTLWSGGPRARRQQAEAFALIRGKVDAIYTAGAPGAQLAAFLGAHEVIELGRHPDRALRVNNQAPIVLTVSGGLLEARPDLVERYLRQLVAAAEWAAGHRTDTLRIVANDVGASEEWVDAAYGADFHTMLKPCLTDERLAALRVQMNFLAEHGFIPSDFDLDAWTDSRPCDALGLVEGR